VPNLFPPSQSRPRFSASILLPLAVLAIAALGGCQTLDTYFPTMRSFGIYKLDVIQGNYLTQDMVDRLKVGLPKQQVRLILGTPLITSAFRDNRWDYVFEFKGQGKPEEHRALTVYFVDDKLARWEGDAMPASQIEANRAAADKTLPHVSSAEDKGFMDWFLDIFRKSSP
jgi:outer membrane protein assembly factor BamE